MDDNKLTITVGSTILAVAGMGACIWVLVDGGGAGHVLLAIGLCVFSCCAAALSMAVK